jgi:hypothetical protein
MDKDLIIFSLEQGNLLVRLLLAHILADFVLQTDNMVANKKWFSKQLFFHVAVIFFTTLFLSFSWKLALTITVTHWIIDALKQQYFHKEKYKFSAFSIDQLLHIAVILVAWIIHFGLYNAILTLIPLYLGNYKIMLLVFAYALAIWPLGFLLKFALHNMAPNEETSKVEHGGKLIGQFERIIILTFVLLNQYEAIGFLITGKSIIRFAQKDENIKSEYVLVGTMMSYALSILIGVLVNWLLK